jgi:uncharacterized protein
MKRTDIENMVKAGRLYRQPFDGEIFDTHISWVIFTVDFALKVKKPVKLSFLDFSTLELRKHFCEQEILLNRRYSDIYLGVVAINKNGKDWSFKKGNQRALDYGIVMKRQDNSLRMDRILADNQISTEDIVKLAQVVANFHEKAKIISAPFELTRAKELFRDLKAVSGYFDHGQDSAWSNFITESIRWSDEFLDYNREQFASRSDGAQIRDVHGDLHSRNIFIDDDPVIFDCIEFNDSFRQIDVWYEVAFLCMDLDFFGHPELSNVFFKEYTRLKKEHVSKEQMRIFVYFKMLRANIRAKVLAMQTNQGDSPKSDKENLLNSTRYLQLMRKYMDELNYSAPEKGD